MISFDSYLLLMAPNSLRLPLVNFRIITLFMLQIISHRFLKNYFYKKWQPEGCLRHQAYPVDNGRARTSSPARSRHLLRPPVFIASRTVSIVVSYFLAIFALILRYPPLNCNLSFPLPADFPGMKASLLIFHDFGLLILPDFVVLGIR